jgi:isopenicillin-N N-acyltransferase-like protein
VKGCLSESKRWGGVSWITLLIVMVSFIREVPACTLWSAAGESVVGGGTLIAKNRDWVPDHQQHLELSSLRDKGYRYLGLIATGHEPGLKSGVNSQGLVWVNASPPSYLERDKSLRHVSGIGRKILAGCKTVKEALSHGEWFVGAQFFMLADRDEVAVIELGLDGKFLVQSTNSGVLFHTNHYIENEFACLNRGKPGVSSAKRYERVQQLMGNKGKFSLSDFIQIGASTEGGPDNSLWRTGSKPNSTRTLATWIVYQPPSGEGVVYLKMANPDKEIKEYRFMLKDVFSGKASISGVE